MNARRSRVATPLAKKRARGGQARAARYRPPRSPDGSSALAASGELDSVAREMAQLTEGERVKRWLQGMRAAAKRIGQLRAEEAAKRATAGADTAARPSRRGDARRNTQPAARPVKARARRSSG